MTTATIPTNALTVIEVDIDDLEFELSLELNNLSSLKVFEDQVIIATNDIEQAYEQVSDAYTRMAYHVHMILQHELWRHELSPDEDNPTVQKQTFSTQEDYLESLAHRTIRGFAVSTVKSFHTAFLMARHLGYSRREIEDKGVYIFNEVSKKVDKRHGTGEPTGLKNGKTPNSTEIVPYLRQVIEDATTNPDKPDLVFKPYDLKLYLEQTLAPRTAKIDFMHIYGTSMNIVQWSHEMYDDAGMLQGQYGKVIVNFDPETPASVMEKFYNLLRINMGNV